ncbi:hypothetical protein BV20DRAFT_1125682 [Pilatotrama ljubarskyi]|nr:hypothetical protein BV20DRAFT_1125682 [Pilatotrama ljubarskyi]
MDPSRQPPGATIVDVVDSVFDWHPDPTLPNPPTKDDDEISDKAAEYARELPHNISALKYHASPEWVASYSFHGNYVQVVGAVIPWISGPLASARFDVDGKNETFVQVNNLTIGAGMLVLYTADGLHTGQHNLTINITQATPDSPFLLDHVDGVEHHRNAGCVPPASLRRNPTDICQFYLTDQHQHSAGVGSSSSSSSPSRPFPLGPVIGAIVGGFALLAALMVFLYCLRRRSRKDAAPEAPEEASAVQVTPFGRGGPKVSLETVSRSDYPSDDLPSIPFAGSDMRPASHSVVTSLPPSWSPPVDIQQQWATLPGASTAQALYHSSPDQRSAYPSPSPDPSTGPTTNETSTRTEKARYIPPTAGAVASSSSGQSTRMLGGVLNYDGKEARLLPTDTATAPFTRPPPSELGSEGSSYDRASTLPPPYAP